MDETYVRVAGQWRYVYRHRPVRAGHPRLRRLVARHKAAHRFFERAIGTTKIAPAEVITDQAPVYPAVLEDLLPAAWHRTARYANNRVECDHGAEGAAGSDARPQPGPQCQGGHRRYAFVQNLRRGHYELAVDEPTNR
jgi:DDE domain